VLAVEVMTVAGEPLISGVHRFPVNLSDPPTSEEPPSAARPFVLRGVTPRPSAGPGAVVRAKHRTPASQRVIPRTTNLDNRVVDDSYTVPDD
jgi:hypothetical protein